MPAAAIDFATADIVMTPERIAVVLNIIAESWQGVKPNCFLMPVSLESVELGNDAPDGAPPSWSMAAGKSKLAAAREAASQFVTRLIQPTRHDFGYIENVDLMIFEVSSFFLNPYNDICLRLTGLIVRDPGWKKDAIQFLPVFRPTVPCVAST